MKLPRFTGNAQSTTMDRVLELFFFMFFFIDGYSCIWGKSLKKLAWKCTSVWNIE